jgi:hypothetical protein
LRFWEVGLGETVSWSCPLKGLMAALTISTAAAMGQTAGRRGAGNTTQSAYRGDTSTLTAESVLINGLMFTYLAGIPGKSAFDQVHVASTASEPNLAETPFSGNYDAKSDRRSAGLFPSCPPSSRNPRTLQLTRVVEPKTLAQPGKDSVWSKWLSGCYQSR